MKMSFRFTVPRLIAMVLASLLPLAAIFLCVKLLTSDIVMSVTFVLTFILLPVVTLALLGLNIFGKRRVVGKTILSILLLIAFVCLFLFLNAFGKFEMLSHYENDQIPSHYRELQKDFPQMPTLSEVGQPIHVDYYDYFSQQMGIFTCDADYLMCRFDDEQYNIQKAQLDQKYAFQVDIMSESGYECEPVVELDGYTFRTLSLEDFNYPKRLMFVATNDDTKQIVYLSFYDDDLDYIVSLEEFLMDDCGWKHIR